MKRSIVLAAVTLAIAACGTPAASNHGAPSNADGHWTLDSATIDGTDFETPADYPITMTLNGDRIGGRAACNSYGGHFGISNGTFSIRDGLAVTEMWCSPDEIMDAEATFLGALARVTTITRTDSGLVLGGVDVELRFTPDPDAGPLPPNDSENPDEPVGSEFFPARTHGSWILVRGEIDGRVVPIVDGHPILLVLGPNSFGGTVCNSFGFAEPFPEDGSFPEIVQTLMACQDDVMESEEVFLEALSRYQGAEVHGVQLTIRGEGMVLVFDPVPTQGSEDTGDTGDGNGSSGSSAIFPAETYGDWVLIEGELDAETIPTGHPITLTVSGTRLSGKACNEYWADVDPSGGLTDFVTTRMACAQPIMDSEIRFLAALSQARIAVVADGRLVVRGASSFLIFDPA
jgi:heat shock protein HslJ